MFLRFFFRKICAHSCVCAKKVVPLSRNMQFRRFGEQKYAKKHIKQYN